MTLKIRSFNKGIRLKPTSESLETVEGALQLDETSKKIQVYVDGASDELILANFTQTLTNKTFDASNNTLSNVDTTHLASGVLDTDLSTVSASDDTIPSAKATKTYVDAQVATVNEASEISYDNSTSGLTATDVKAALDEIDGRVDTLEAAQPSGDVVGTTDTQTLTNKTIDADSNSLSNIDNNEIKAGAAIDATKIHDGTVDNTEFGYLDGVTSSIQTQIDSKADDADLTAHTGASSGVHGVTGNVVGTTDTQTLTNKTFSGGTVSGGTSIENPTRLDPKKDTFSNLVTYASTASDGELVFATDTGKFYYVFSGALEEAGGGATGINYVTNPDAESDASDWNTYADSAGTQPVDGTGGTANVTLTRTTTNPLRETGSFLLSKDAADRQGEGTSTELDTIARADYPAVLRVSFDYETTANYADGDARVYIYDVTNSRLIEPANTEIVATDGNTHRADFQTSADSDDYRLIIHIASTNSSAWDLKFDNVIVEPQDFGSFGVSRDVVFSAEGASPGTSVPHNSATKLDSWTVLEDTISAWDSGNSEYVIKESGYYDIAAAAKGDSGGNNDLNLTQIYINKNGSSIYRKRLDSSGEQQHHPEITAIAVPLVAGDTVSISIFQQNSSSSAYTFGSNTEFDFFQVAKRQSGQSAGAFAGRDIAAHAYTTGQSISTTAETTVELEATTVDTTASHDTSTYTYTVPESGIYSMKASLHLGNAGAELYTLRVRRGGSETLISREFETGGVNPWPHCDGIRELQAGDELTLTIQSTADSSYALINDNSVGFYIHKISNSQQIAAGEKVLASYESTSAQSFASGSEDIIDFSNKNFDTHVAVTTGSSWKFVAPSSGFYYINAQAALISTADDADADEWVRLRLYKNNTLQKLLEFIELFANDVTASNQFFTPSGSAILELNKGDEIDVRLEHSFGSSQSLSSSAGRNIIEIYKI